VKSRAADFEVGLTTDDVPRDAQISVATLTELSVDVRRAGTDSLRELRGVTLARARRFIALQYDEVVAERLAELHAVARSRRRRAGAMDAVVEATAVAHDPTAWIRDDDFGVVADLLPELPVHRG